MPTFGPTSVFTNGSTTESLFTPLTGTFESQGVVGVKLAWYSTGLVAGGSLGNTIEVVPGIQYSNDGIVWDSPKLSQTVEWSCVDNFTYESKTIDCPSGWEGLTSNEVKTFVRFGLFAKNTGTWQTAACLNAQVFLNVSFVPIESGAVVCGPTATVSSGSTSLYYFTPMSAAIRLDRMTAVRATCEMDASTSLIETKPGYQTSEDGVTWSDGFSDIGTPTPLSANGISYGKDVSIDFTAVSANHRYVRFGIAAQNTSGTRVEACLSTLKVDWRCGS